MNRIDDHFQRAREQGAKSLILFLTAGYPDMAASVDLAVAAVEAGADIIEFGIPFSDPIADGPTIQRSSMLALERGATLDKALDGVREFRHRCEAPMLLMGSVNPFLRRGVDKSIADSKAAGADGFILPDLPPEESEEFESVCASKDMALIHLIAPTSPVERRRMIAERSRGFVYYMSLKGVTGAREALPEDIAERLREMRTLTDKPLAVGFGISRPEHARGFAPHCDAIVVGSAFINTIAEHEGNPELIDAAKRFTGSLADALRSP